MEVWMGLHLYLLEAPCRCWSCLPCTLKMTQFVPLGHFVFTLSGLWILLRIRGVSDIGKLAENTTSIRLAVLIIASEFGLKEQSNYFTGQSWGRCLLYSACHKLNNLYTTISSTILAQFPHIIFCCFCRICLHNLLFKQCTKLRESCNISKIACQLIDSSITKVKISRPFIPIC